MSDHNAPIPPPVQKPHPDARMMQTMAGEWLWAVPCERLSTPQPAADLRALRHALESLVGNSATIASAAIRLRMRGYAEDGLHYLAKLEAALASAPQPAEGRTQEKARTERRKTGPCGHCGMSHVDCDGAAIESGSGCCGLCDHWQPVAPEGARP